MKKREWELLIDFYLINQDGIILRELADKLDINPCDPYFRNLLSILEINEIIKFSESYGNVKIIHILNLKKLRKIIEESDYWKRFYDYINKTRGIVAF